MKEIRVGDLVRHTEDYIKYRVVCGYSCYRVENGRNVEFIVEQREFWQLVCKEYILVQRCETITLLVE